MHPNGTGIFNEPLTTEDIGVSGGTLVFDARVTVNGPLAMSEAAELTLNPHGANAPYILDVQSLTVGGTSIINMADNVVIVDYTAKGDGGSPLEDIKVLLTTGYNNGWNPPNLPARAIISTTAAASPGHALGYADDGNVVLIRYTRYGDADLSGNVNLNDFNRLAANFGATGTLWSQGNFNYDNNTNLNDFNLLAANFGQSASPLGRDSVPWTGSMTTPDDDRLDELA